MEDIKESYQEEWTDKYSVMKSFSKVYSRIRKDIGEDFVLAWLNDKDREMFEGMIGMAFFTKRAIEDIKMKKKWKWDKYKKGWILDELDKSEKILIDKYANDTHDLLMNKPYITAVLKRNVKDNWLVGEIIKRVREDENIVNQQEALSEKEGIITRLTENREKEKGE